MGEAAPLRETSCDEELQGPLCSKTVSNSSAITVRRIMCGSMLGVACIVAIFLVTMQESSDDLFSKSADVAAATQLATVRECYDYTGGTCRSGWAKGNSSNGCDERRKANCDPTLKVCQCIASCAGSDGACHLGENLFIKGAFRLKNAKWTKYAAMFKRMSVFGQLTTSKNWAWQNGRKDQFTLYKMSEEPGTNIADARFLLGSEKWPGVVARIAWTSGTSLGQHGLYAQKLNKRKGPDRLALFVCFDEAGNGIRIADNTKSTWAYMKHGTWLVYAYKTKNPSKVGNGGLWTTEPPLTEVEKAALPTCN